MSCAGDNRPCDCIHFASLCVLCKRRWVLELYMEHVTHLWQSNLFDTGMDKSSTIATIYEFFQLLPIRTQASRITAWLSDQVDFLPRTSRHRCPLFDRGADAFGCSSWTLRSAVWYTEYPASSPRQPRPEICSRHPLGCNRCRCWRLCPLCWLRYDWTVRDGPVSSCFLRKASILKAVQEESEDLLREAMTLAHSAGQVIHSHEEIKMRLFVLSESLVSLACCAGNCFTIMIYHLLTQNLLTWI